MTKKHFDEKMLYRKNLDVTLEKLGPHCKRVAASEHSNRK